MDSTRSHRFRVPDAAWAVILFVAYVTMLVLGRGTELAHASLAISVAPLLAIVPLLTGAWLFGRRFAIASAVLFVPFLAVLLATDRSLGRDVFGGAAGLTEFVAIIAITVLAGFASDSRRSIASRLNAQGTIVAAVSHEVRTPLTAIVGIAQELDANWDSIPDETRRELVGLVAEQAADMTAIVDDLLAGAKAEQGKLRIEPQTVDLSDVVVSVMNQLRIAPLPISGSARAWADPKRVRQVMRNLVVNARRYGGKDIALVCGTDGGHAYFEVCDDGVGVPVGQLDELFSPYAGTEHRPDSTGLGLAFSRHLAVMMGGNLTYRREGERTVFRLTLPRAVYVS